MNLLKVLFCLLVLLTISPIQSECRVQYKGIYRTLPQEFCNLMNTFHGGLLEPRIANFNSLILYGTTGTGKTSLAEAFAQQTNSELRRYSFPGLLTEIQRSGANEIKKIFEDAVEANRKIIILIDDIANTARPNTSFEQSIVYQELNNQLDNLVTNQNVIMIYTTNNLDACPTGFKSRCNTFETNTLSLQDRKDLLKHFFINNCALNFPESEVKQLCQTIQDKAPENLKNITQPLEELIKQIQSDTIKISVDGLNASAIANIRNNSANIKKIMSSYPENQNESFSLKKRVLDP